MARVDVNPTARELVDLSAESVKMLGNHLEQIGGIISGAKVPRLEGDRGAAARIKDKLALYKKYQIRVCERQEEIEARLASDFEAMSAWRRESGTEGADLIKELETYIARVRELTKLLAEEKEVVAGLRQDVADLKMVIVVKDKKWASLAEAFILTKELKKKDSYMRAGLSSWLQSAFDEVRFKFKAQQEKERLLTEHHRRMRKARAQARLDCIMRERDKRLKQSCFLALQEECVEGRAERHLEELRIKHEDQILVYEGQIAQLLGDEEKAKQIVAEQVRRMEEARRRQREAEKQRDEYRKKMRKALQEKEEALAEREAALAAKAEAVAAMNIAMDESTKAKLALAEQTALMEKGKADLLLAEATLLKTQRELKKKIKKIDSLQRMLAELGAESDSDAPPDERAPPFFTNEDGSKAPRPRTRKERMSMAYREAESARCELRLGMAAMIDKDINSATQVNKLRLELARCQREITEVRWANQVLAEDANVAAQQLAKGIRRPHTAGTPKSQDDQNAIHAPFPPPPGVALAASLAAAPPYSPSRPTFVPAEGESIRSPRLMLKTASQPIIMPQLVNEKDKITLAPLRTLKKPMNEWRVSWH
eukprot:TRINITY_DN14280_c0_g3_i2.p1 TRINITY_DN14280_c0_g3~~TRINITY_DN14280_c0_g3_i2.p1  ORF type:complete len:637 (+),score=192.12 TRINITY_DN14280_c0_g3_i2:118-1911(+)